MQMKRASAPLLLKTGRAAMRYANRAHTGAFPGCGQEEYAGDGYPNRKTARSRYNACLPASRVVAPIARKVG